MKTYCLHDKPVNREPEFFILLFNNTYNIREALTDIVAEEKVDLNGKRMEILWSLQNQIYTELLRGLLHSGTVHSLH